MNKRQQFAALTFMVAAMAMSGCGSSVSYNPERSGVYVMKDGTVRSAEVEAFDNSGFAEERYREDELLAFVEESVIAYNKETCGQEAAYKKDAEGLNVGIVELKVKDDLAKLILEYASADQYVSFNESDDSVQKLEIYTAPDAVAKGVSLDGLTDAEGKAVDTSSMQTNEKYCAVVISGTTEVVVNGKIAGVSGEAQVTDSHTVEVSGENDVVILFK